MPEPSAGGRVFLHPRAKAVQRVQSWGPQTVRPCSKLFAEVCSVPSVAAQRRGSVQSEGGLLGLHTPSSLARGFPCSSAVPWRVAPPPPQAVGYFTFPEPPEGLGHLKHRNFNRLQVMVSAKLSSPNYHHQLSFSFLK